MNKKRHFNFYMVLCSANVMKNETSIKIYSIGPTLFYLITCKKSI